MLEYRPTPLHRLLLGQPRELHRRILARRELHEHRHPLNLLCPWTPEAEFSIDRRCKIQVISVHVTILLCDEVSVTPLLNLFAQCFLKQWIFLIYATLIQAKVRAQCSPNHHCARDPFHIIVLSVDEQQLPNQVRMEKRYPYVVAALNYLFSIDFWCGACVNLASLSRNAHESTVYAVSLNLFYYYYFS